MNELGLGKLVWADKKRDATHIAVIPLECNYYLRPGDSVRLKHDKTAVACNPDDTECVGIVDPFLPHNDIHHVEKGQRFWCWLKPGTVTGMRHHWEHPAFQPPDKNSIISDHKAWLLNFCDSWNFDFDELIESGTKGGYVTALGMDLHSKEELNPGEEELFWYHLEKYTGLDFDGEHREKMGWSCSC